jgi:hypothetical protein
MSSFLPFPSSPLYIRWDPALKKLMSRHGEWIWTHNLTSSIGSLNDELDHSTRLPPPSFNKCMFNFFFNFCIFFTFLGFPEFFQLYDKKSWLFTLAYNTQLI